VGRRLSLAALASALLVLGQLNLGGDASESRAAQACRASQLDVSVGPNLSPPTGRHDLSLRLRNRGPTCRSQGYPRLTLLDRRGDVLPIELRHGGGMIVGSRPPRPVVVRPGGVAWIVFEQYRCDLGGGRAVGTALVRLPRTKEALRLRFAPGREGLHFCGKGDPGSTVFVSPVVPTQRAALHVYGRGP
jgi:hypothetical protein